MEDRIIKLEKTCARYKMFFVLMGIFLVAAFTISATLNSSGHLRVKSLTVLSSKGEKIIKIGPRWDIWPDKTEGSIVFYSKGDKEKLLMGANSFGSYIELYGSNLTGNYSFSKVRIASSEGLVMTNNEPRKIFSKKDVLKMVREKRPVPRQPVIRLGHLWYSDYPSYGLVIYDYRGKSKYFFTTDDSAYNAPKPTFPYKLPSPK